MSTDFEDKQSLYLIRSDTHNTIHRVLSHDLISPSESLRQKWNEDFQSSFLIHRYLAIFEFIGISFSACIMITSMVILAVFVRVPFWVYMGYAAIGFLGLVSGIIIAQVVKNESRLISREELLTHNMCHLINWTIDRLSKETDDNNRRFFIENLLNSVFNYEHNPRISLGKLNHIEERVRKVVDSKNALESIKVSLRLFEIIFSDEQTIFDESGVLYMIKVFVPLQRVTGCPKTSEMISQLFKKLICDTRININESKYSLLGKCEKPNVLVPPP